MLAVDVLFVICARVLRAVTESHVRWTADMSLSYQACFLQWILQILKAAHAFKT